MKAPKLPTCGLHKPTGQARCYVNGKTVYLGLYGSKESRIRYGEIVAKIVSGQTIDPIARSKSGSSTCQESDDPGPSVGELILVFLRHAKRHYVKNGKPTTEYGILESTVRPLNELYGMIPAKDFGPKAQLVLAKYLSADPDAKMFKMTRQSYTRAVSRACDKAKIDRWCPHQLRHTAADVIRDEFGLEHAQSVLGHSTANMTEHYARVGNARAAEVAGKIG